MRVLCIGGGSMGRRRLRDLTHLRAGEVSLLEPVEARCAEVSAALGVKGFTDADRAFDQRLDAVVVSTPPSLHEPYVRRALDLGAHVFAEVPFVLDEAAMAEVARRAATHRGVVGISHSMRYYPPVAIIREAVRAGRIGRPLYFEHSLGNFLPEWHPYEDYRAFYGADAALGGAGTDMLLHEVAAFTTWMGEIASVEARFHKLGALEIKGPDSQDVLLAFAGGARGFLHFDLLERGTAGRHVRVVGEDGTLEWHQNRPEVRFFDGVAGRERSLPFSEASDWPEALEASRQVREVVARLKTRSGTPPASGDASFSYESCYLREMKHFLGAARGEHAFTRATVAEELHALRAFHAMRRSAETRREVSVPR